jgi:hypothetical protein
MAEVTQRTFDLHSWKGLTEVLQIARNSRLSRADYAHFRDLVLSYAQEGGDQGKKIHIEKILSTLETLPDPKNAEAIVPTSTSRPITTNGRRIVPTFGVRKLEVGQTTSRPPLPPREQAQHTAVTHEISEPKVVAEKAPSESDTKLEKEEVTSVTTSTHVSEEVSGEAIPVPTPPAVKVESEVKSLEEYRARIMEVKRQVNARVGNPVTLIDAGNQLGRTYMNALLNAMKATNPGSTMNIVGAMKDLEVAYDAVVAHVEGRIPSAAVPAEVHSTKDESVSNEPPHTSTPHTDSEASGAEKIEDTETPVVNTGAERVETEHAILSTNKENSVERREEKPVEKPTETVVPPTPTRARIPSLADIERTQVPKSTDASSPVAEEKKPGFSLSALTRPKATEREVTKSSQTPLPVPASSGDQKPSVASDVRRPVLTGGRHIPASPVVEVSKMMPPKPDALLGNLVTPEITQSLGQLLHEWNLFASSGLFGTGPGGFEHPLYKKLSEVKMEEVVLGRWDGAQPKVTSAIRDYIDAWRHEQGVAYNPTETFEHYLRRVVDRILKRQKGIRGV